MIEQLSDASVAALNAGHAVETRNCLRDLSTDDLDAASVILAELLIVIQQLYDKRTGHVRRVPDETLSAAVEKVMGLRDADR